MLRMIIFVVLVGLSACVSVPQTARILNDAAMQQKFTEPIVLSNVQFFSQQEFQCGPAALASVLRSSHVKVTPEDLVPLVYVPLRRGSLQVELLAATRYYERIAYVLPRSLESVLKEVQQGRPVLVMQNLGLEWYPRWHYAVVIGYDIKHRELILNSGRIEHYRVSLSTFERTWRRADRWAMVALAPGEFPVDADELAYLEALSSLLQTQPEANVQPAFIVGIKRWPESTLLPMGLGNLLYIQGRKREAAEQFSSVIELDPAYAPAHNNLAQTLLDLGDSKGALEHAQTAVALGGAHHKVYEATLDAINNK